MTFLETNKNSFTTFPREKINFYLKIHNIYVNFRRNAGKIRNQRMRSYNGNKNGFQNQIGIFQQNVQGKTMSVPDQISTVEKTLSKLNCDILIISEADTENICNWHYPGYSAHKGQLLGKP